MMARYIDADEVLRHFSCTSCTDDILEYLQEAPTADVVEVKHGEWYRHNKKEHGDTCYYCSACEKMALSDCLEWELTKYCPNCGAKMDGGKAE